MCVTQYDCIYQPPSRSSMGLFQILELIVMGVCGLLCAGNLIEIINSKSSANNVVLILTIVGDVLVVAGLVLVFIGLFCPCQPSNLRTGIICFVVGSIIFAVAIGLLFWAKAEAKKGKTLGGILTIIVGVIMIFTGSLVNLILGIAFIVMAIAYFAALKSKK